MHPSNKSVHIRSASSAPVSALSKLPRKACRACERCTRTKKKCDKSLPSCSRCKRLKGKCCYDFIYTPSVTVIARPENLADSPSDGINYSVSQEAQVESPPESIQTQGVFMPFLDISSSTILNLLSSRNTTASQSVKYYMETINPYLAIVHPELFALRTNNTGYESISDQDLHDPSTALLAVCMHLFAQQDGSVKSIGDEGVEMPIYRAAKQILGILRTLNTPCIELIQCSLVLAFYEYIHGDLRRAYVSIGDANTMAMILRVGPGKYLEAEWDAYVPYEEEESRCLYWSLFVLDCLIQTDYSLLHMPHQIPPPIVSPPLADDLLPTNHLLRFDDDQSPHYVTHRYPANTTFSVPVGVFQRNCQCAMLYNRTSFPQSIYKSVSPTENSLSSRQYDTILKWSSSFSPLLFGTHLSTWEPDGVELFSPYGEGIATPDTTSDITESLLLFQKDIDDLVLQNETEAARTAFKKSDHVI